MSKMEPKNNKLTKKQKYIIIAVVAVVVALVATWFVVKSRKPVIGYQPDIPQEWFEQIEAEKNSPTVVFVRTFDLHGVWRSRSTGEYFNVNNNGSIYKVETPDSKIYELDQWGNVFAEQVIDRTVAEGLMQGGGNPLVPGDEYSLLINSMYTDIYDAKAVIIDEKTVKTVSLDGREFIFDFIKKIEQVEE